MNFMKTGKSTKEKIWELRCAQPTDDGGAEAAISSALGVSPIVARLLCGRGYKTPEAARIFLTMGDTLIHDPFLLPDMAAAVERIERALADPVGAYRDIRRLRR